VLGVVCTVLVLLVVVDPPRGASEGITHQAAGSWQSDVRYLFRQYVTHYTFNSLETNSKAVVDKPNN